MIQPTIGRVVWFWPAKDEVENFDQPNVAGDTYVWGERMVGLVVFDANGKSRGETSVTLLQDDEKGQALGQAKRHEAEKD